MRVLAIDPALRKTGFAVIEQQFPPAGQRGAAVYKALVYGTIKNATKLRPSSCLVEIRQHLVDVVREHQPEVCAVEGVIYVQSFKTAITMGAARGAAILAAAEQGLEVYEYAPKRVKQAVVGRGNADKQQVAFMMRALLGLTETPDPDAADALAIGMAHLYAHDPNRPLANQSVPI